MGIWTLTNDELTLPNKVVGLHILEGKSLLCAWREYKGISPDEMAEGMGMTRDEYLQTENKKTLSSYILKKAADLLGTDSRLLTED
jgi:transcriptional regulator with XRE-family HTH domain